MLVTGGDCQSPVTSENDLAAVCDSTDRSRKPIGVRCGGTDVERTPDKHFEGLPDWPYEPRCATVGEGLRMHCIDEGPSGVAAG
ncbi:hypothetical protein ACIBFB_13080 [Nocardiopsis sp. NPDC050513]|uniref:hypothetical protein n=1 Tax=Nocardiopsis sp. NPDC050513 TaxID=3364338 RepID=UPI00378B7592